MKAWGRRLPWKGIEVRSGEKGNPFVVFQGVRYDEVSISHERKFAVAVVRVEEYSMIVLSPERMKKYDEYAISTWGIPPRCSWRMRAGARTGCMRETYLRPEAGWP